MKFKLNISIKKQKGALRDSNPDHLLRRETLFHYAKSTSVHYELNIMIILIHINLTSKMIVFQ